MLRGHQLTARPVSGYDHFASIEPRLQPALGGTAGEPPCTWEIWYCEAVMWGSALLTLAAVCCAESAMQANSIIAAHDTPSMPSALDPSSPMGPGLRVCAAAAAGTATSSADSSSCLLRQSSPAAGVGSKAEQHRVRHQSGLRVSAVRLCWCLLERVSSWCLFTLAGSFHPCACAQSTSVRMRVHVQVYASLAHLK